MHRPFFLILISFLLTACGGVTYPDEKLVESLENILLAEYSIKDIQIGRRGTSLWIHVPVEKVYDEKLELDEKSMEKVNNVSFSATRVFLSSDADIEFICIYAFGKEGMELRMIRHTKDIEKARMWYISMQDLQERSEISIDFNPAVYGKKVLTNLKKRDESAIESSIVAEKREELKNRIPTFTEIKELKAYRKSDDRALVYMQTDADKERLLFLVDTAFSDILKNLIFLVQSARRDENQQDPLAEVSLPLIAGFWDLEEGMPTEFEYMPAPDEWPEQVIYSRAVDFNTFIADQIERRIRGKLAARAADWDTEISDLEVLFPSDSIIVTARAKRGEDARYGVDPEHEILLILSQTVKDYDIDIETVILRPSIWGEEKVFTKEELEEIRPKRWRRIRREGEPNLADIIVSFLAPSLPSEEENKENDGEN